MSALETNCTCGYKFIGNEIFCRKCGAHKPAMNMENYCSNQKCSAYRAVLNIGENYCGLCGNPTKSYKETHESLSSK